jgi:hypothetical protein
MHAPKTTSVFGVVAGIHEGKEGGDECLSDMKAI